MTDDGMILWGANRLPADLDGRIDTARAAGCTAMSLFPLDVRRAQALGVRPGELAARAADAGVPIRVLDPLTNWLPGWELPPGLSEGDRMFLDVDEVEFFATADALGVRSMTVIEAFGVRVEPDVAAAAFARICDAAAEHGLRVHLEFLPWSGIGDLATAWQVVQDADRPNGGLVLDSWHFFRSGSTLPELRQIPGDRVFAVQLSDGPAMAAADLAQESSSGRLVPGDGTFDLTGLVATLSQIGGLTAVGPEVFSTGLWDMPAHQAGSLVGAATRTLLAAVR